MSPIHIPGYTHLYSGKVRDLYVPLDSTGTPRDDQVLLVASDRISAFDYVLDTPIPDKGALLTQLSLWWFEQLADLAPNQVLSTEVPDVVRGRAVLVEKLRMLPVECIGRAYLTGTGLAEYQATGAVSGVPLPAGLRESDRLNEVIFTPSTKAELGEHDELITFAQVVDAVGENLAEKARTLTIDILTRANEVAAQRGILIADTKVEFGRRADSEDLVLADEVLTPDSSRFWRADSYVPGQVQKSFDKQFVRNWLLSPESGWDRHSGQAPPSLPDHVVQETRDCYVQAYEMLTGRTFTP